MTIKNHRKSLRIRLEPELLALLNESAKENERTLNAEIVYCLKKFLILVPNLQELSPAELKRFEKMKAEAKPLTIPGLSMPDTNEQANVHSKPIKY